MKAKGSGKKPIEQYDHKGKKRINNPPVGLVTPETDRESGKRKYAYDPHIDPALQFDSQRSRVEKIIDGGLGAATLEEAKTALAELKRLQEPYLNWAGKAEHTSFEVPTVSLHVHERIDPRTIIEAVRKKNGQSFKQMSLFATREENPPLREAIEFYKHKHNWSNRLIAGDSLLVMNSLLEKEGMAGQVQMVYIDPPYGIKYGSNFQPFVNKRDVKDGKDEDLTQEPEMIKAFRDTWELGIHSYLTYLRDRLLLVRELLTESGSVFVQISDENVHHVRELMDEVFGAGNFIAVVAYRVFGVRAGRFLDNVTDNVIWYGKDREKAKYRQLFLPQEEASEDFEPVRLYRPGYSEGLNFDFEFDGKVYCPPSNMHWATGRDGLRKLKAADRLIGFKADVRYKRHTTDFPCKVLTTSWQDTWGEQEKHYVVQTSSQVVARCLLMTTDPGDLVFDPTCGSGTTAYVAEQWGRRWITCDTSRVAIALAKQRLMTAVFDYYELAHPDEGVGSGFKYKTVPHITLKSIANNEEIDRIWDKYHPEIEKALADFNKAAKLSLKEWEVPFDFNPSWPAAAEEPLERFKKLKKQMQDKMNESIRRNAPVETLYDQPFVDNSKARVTGPFTVEAVPAPVVLPLASGEWTVDSGELGADEERSETASTKHLPLTTDNSIARSGETLRQAEWRDELFKCGIRAKNGQYILFSRVEPLAGTRWLHADAETKPNDLGADSVREARTAYMSPQRAVISFGPEHGPLEQRQVALAIEEAQTLVPKPKLIIFAAFQFDPEAAKDIDETDWPGVTLLKVQMNTDLLTDDLKKKRASNESFWLIGQPDVRVVSEEWLVDSSNRGLLPYECCKKLSGFDSLAEINRLGTKDISVYAAISQRRDLWVNIANQKGCGLDSGKYSGGTVKEQHGRVQTVPRDGEGFAGRIGNAADFVREIDLLGKDKCGRIIEQLRRDKQIVERASKITIHSPLTTRHYYQVEVLGFDYYNTKTGAIESGGPERIAMWMLDTDYDGRSLFPRQVFFPMAGEKDGWSRLAKNLKAEIDQELIEAYRGTVSLPFEAGKNRRIAVKIVDDRGIESLKIIEVE